MKTLTHSPTLPDKVSPQAQRSTHSPIKGGQMQVNPNPSGLCQCGCGMQTNLIRTSSPKRGLVKGKPHKFIIGHHRRGKLQNVSENNGMWKGDQVGLCALHDWVRRRKPKPKLCENCKKNEPSDLSNILGKYKRDVSDYEWICRACHMKKDDRIKNLLVGRSPA